MYDFNYDTHYACNDKQLCKRAFVEINLDNISHNLNRIKSLLKKTSTEIMCIIKANAYGHGAISVAKHLERNGINFFGVACINEAISLRKAGIKANILNLGYLENDLIDLAIKNDVTQSIISFEHAKNMHGYCKMNNLSMKCHLKLDTGMTRLGLDCFCDDIVSKIIEINNMDTLYLEGIFTHLSVADEKIDSSKDFTKNQISLFNDVVLKTNIDFKYKHFANSAGVITYKDSYCNMVRPGTILYGLSPSFDFLDECRDFKPALTLKSRVCLIKEVENGRSVSYGRKYLTKGKKKLAIISIGYGDGYPRIACNSYVSINEQKAYIVGRICMDQFVVDVTHISDIKVDDEVILFGEGKNCLTTDEFSYSINTVPIETTCLLSNRIKRIYKDVN